MGLKIAVIPWAEQFNGDRMFDKNDKVCNRDGLMEPFIEMKQEMERRGDSLHTLDMYDINEVDYFLFFILNWKIATKIVRLGKADRMVYCNSEPPCVEPMNSPKGYRDIRRIFPYILTWNDDWVDNKTIFKRNDPYIFRDNRTGALCFDEKKLITSISSNKISAHPDELYSERLRAIEYFEKNCPENFDFYGVGWNPEEHRCYKGKVDNKTDFFHKYRFSICYENMRNIKGYISEKILDCLTSGIVPIYAGADDIANYVPKDCFIALDDYDDYDSLTEYLINMSKEEYNNYLAAADRFLKSDEKSYFESKFYVECLYRVFKDNKIFKVSLHGRLNLIKEKLEGNA